MNPYTFFTTNALIEAIGKASELYAFKVAHNFPAGEICHMLSELTEELSRRYSDDR